MYQVIGVPLHRKTHKKTLSVHFVLRKILAKSLFCSLQHTFKMFLLLEIPCHQMAAMKSNRLWKAVFTQPSFSLALIEKKIWQDNKEESGTISKSNWRINPVQLYFLIVWNNCFFLHFSHERDNRKENWTWQSHFCDNYWEKHSL